MCKTTFAIKLRITPTCSQVKAVRTMTVVAHALLVARVVLADVLGLLRVVVGRLVRQTVYQAVAAAARAVALRALVVVAARAQAAVLGVVVNPAPQTAQVRALVVVQVLTPN
ncbi:hypothetical protein DRD76_00420 [Salmonella enterica subsp. enterica serovar Weltevreden]|nr:hypothetical protein [Salmonella enterica subsp. enterica serovar Chester]EBU8165161.1 hypothetical protein [Salmonella enterica subsp. enterica serovar Stanleyville]EBW8959842.1 hypothetical protein [Salmonella enterica subsp. enterica serovar Javiana]EBX2234611.1 hypothetical protein [Salmonella enterica subsp. enterica serovar Weltevreden]EBY3806519.1 hypothetical protein [Salmonella enterica subsp. enterica serovar Adabraka]ECD2129208.1 hypothetical protein [Salmonella enterica subsp. e